MAQATAGGFAAGGKVIKAEGGVVHFAPSGTNYELHLAARGYSVPASALVRGTIRVQARKVLDVTLSILYSPNNKQKRLGLNVPEDWQSALDLLQKYTEFKTDMKADQFYTNEFVPESV